MCADWGSLFILDVSVSPHHAGTSAAILGPRGSEKQPALWSSRSKRRKESKLSLLAWSSKMHYPPSRATCIYESLIVRKCISLHTCSQVRQGFQLPANKVTLCLCLMTWHIYFLCGNRRASDENSIVLLHKHLPVCVCPCIRHWRHSDDKTDPCLSSWSFALFLFIL